eukprot:CAMPEP_0202945364 /NCGR_PEP_ID=MMETSP1395-20130829/6374_1 /ASSEMBLY_ACC=CAM_ASM_000871 /TAXON_ID=5961 /ORGANISM="Blepharisma japonicum, Strain Stock R1072" /LENGTH=353 /DNA_ID=CAMNT_0049645301 /DNA_START=30 /DNA_END=1091 /DNA_ORIENTATION=+
MNKFYFEESERPSNKKKVLLGAIAVLAVVGVVATVAVLSSSSSNEYALRQYEIDEQEFFGFIAKFNKVYKDMDEFQARFRIFRDNAAYARVHNTLGRSYLLGITQFADLSHDEFSALYTPNKYTPSEETADFVPDLSAVPTQVDWRTKGAVTAVKNQGQCGSCWSFATTGAVEGTWFLAGHTLVSLSEQELMDCSSKYGNQGCDGGLATNAFKYVVASGLTTEANYPYVTKVTACNASKVSQVAAKISSYSIVAANEPNALMAAVVNKPIAVGVQGNEASWQLYKGGIVTSDCGTDLDHAVLVVGYNNANSPPYWIVKNSWGASWGEEGYIRIGISPGKGICGINMNPSFPNA